MDLRPAWQKGVQETCRNAPVVFDQFHVLMNANKAVDEVRRAEVRLGGAGVWEATRLAGIDQKSLRTAKAYPMRLGLPDIYRRATAGVACHRWGVWCRWVRWGA